MSIGFRNPIKLMAETAVYGNVCDLKDIDGGKGKGVSLGIHEISSNFFFNFTKVIYLIIPKESNEKRIKGPMVQGKMFLKWRTLISSFVKIFVLTFFWGKRNLHQINHFQQDAFAHGRLKSKWINF